MIIDHVAICAKNTTALKNWYTRVFGTQVCNIIEGSKPTYFLSTESSVTIEIYPCKGDTEMTGNFSRGLRHLSLYTNDIEAELDNLTKHNISYIPELTNLSDGPVKTIYFRDPEGNLIHFLQRF